MQAGKAPLNHTTDPGDLHAQIQAMIAAAQGAPMQPAAPPQMPQVMPPMPGQQGAPGPAMPQMGGSPENVQRAMMARAIRG
jgi:hypothetical protein